MAVKSPMFFKNTVALTTRSREEPAASRTPPEIFHHAAGLSRDVALDEIAGLGIEWNLPGSVNEIADLDRLFVGADGLGCFLRADDFLLHGAAPPICCNL
jgi:hypothetical protein